MMEKQLRHEANKIRQELQEIRDRVAAMRQTYDEMEAISSLIRGQHRP